MTAIIQARGLVKSYGEVRALRGLDLTVDQGSVVGVLGPNGAGKTTAVSILTTLVEPDAGTAVVAGADVVSQPDSVRRCIGVAGQYAAIDEQLTGFENLDMIGRLSRLGRRRARTRAAELLERFSLAADGDRPAKTYSGGMRRRLDLAGALVTDAPVLFLDEPTTGLDPRSRAQLWDVIRELVAQGRTLLLTTQYLEEADQLADEIVVIDHGRQIAKGTADQLKSNVGAERIEVIVRSPDDVEATRRALGQHASGGVYVAGRSVTVPVAGGPTTLAAAIATLDAEGIAVHDIGMRRPSLDDVFLTLTGRTAESQTTNEAA